MLKEVDIQEVCDQCCESPDVHVNNQYIGEIFQWLINNDYQIAKNEPMKLTDPNVYYGIRRTIQRRRMERKPRRTH
jgi:hypothetical protein